jgi:hypothetical protein
MRSWVQHEIRQLWGGILYSVPDVKWINHPLAISAAGYKPEQLGRAVKFGMLVPETLITSDCAQAEEFCREHFWNVVAKPIGHGEIRDEHNQARHLVYTNLVKENHRNAISRVKHCPTLLQRHIAKSLDVRVSVAGSQCIGIALHSQEHEESRVDCRRENMRRMRYSLTDYLET